MKKYLGCFVTILAVIFARLIPFSWIIGSSGFYFSWSTMIAPVVAKHLAISWVGLFFIAKKKLTISVLLLHCMHRLPLLGAACAYKKRHWFFSIGIPLICMTLFMLHDVGSVAWPYAMCWFIPIALWLVPETLFSRALIASFVAHAIGSVVWLYAGDVPAVVWMGLIPILLVERLLMAIGIIGCDLFVVHGVWIYRNLTQRVKTVRVI